MWEALRVAAADDFVGEHADGLHMQLAQGGSICPAGSGRCWRSHAR
ncbi:ABC transporter, ATP-binding domain protein [Mycobacterium kansasii 732]|nr:ABC transporter, ATP-binding domain protein [Mycobacterium kansasii 732]